MFWAVYQVLLQTSYFTFLVILFHRSVNRGSKGSCKCSTLIQLETSKASISSITLAVESSISESQTQVFAGPGCQGVEIERNQRACAPGSKDLKRQLHPASICHGETGPRWPELLVGQEN